MTNETTASQPKSIGDDAQFRRLMNAWDASEHGADANRIYDEIAAYIDSRAPAAQASAFLSLADDDGFRLALSKYNVGELTEKDFIEFLDGHAKQAAQASVPIQAAPNANTAVDQYGTTRCASCDANLDINEEHGDECSAAAIQEPVMVAEPMDNTDQSGSYARPIGPLKWREFAGSVYAAMRAFDGTWGKSSNEMRRQSLEDKAKRLMRARASAAPMVADPAGVTLEMIQWRNIQKVVAAVADFCFGSKDDPVYGSSHCAVTTCLTAKDGVQVTLETLAATVKAVPSEALELCKECDGEGGTILDLCYKCKGSGKIAAPLADKTDDATTKPGA